MLCLLSLLASFLVTIAIATMSVAFVSFELTPGKPVVPSIPEGYVMNISQAALALEKVDDTKGGYLQVYVKTKSIEGDDLNALVGTLRAGQVEQFALNLVFGEDDEIIFSVKGTAKGSVHLSGYYQPGPEEEDDEDDDDDRRQAMHDKDDYDYDSDEDDDDEMDDVLLR